MSAYPPMRTTTDTYTGKPFRWNDVVLVDHRDHGRILTPARTTSRTHTWLHPDRVPLALLRELNPDNVTLATSNAHPVLGALADNDPMSCVHGVSMSLHCRECEAR